MGIRVEKFTKEVRFALRALRRSPVFVTIALLSLALGIGANTAIFTLFDQVMLRRLPVHRPEELVLLDAKGPFYGSVRNRDEDSLYFSYPMYRDLRDRNSAFSGLIATCPFPVAIGAQGQTENGSIEIVSGNYFEMLGVQPAAGRLFASTDDTTPGANVVGVLGFGYWKRRFGMDPAVVGQTIRLNNHPFVVAGVAPPGFRSITVGDAPDVFIPMAMQPQVLGWSGLEDHKFRWLTIAGRIKPGLTPVSAEASMQPVWRALREADLPLISEQTPRFLQEYRNTRLTLRPGARGFSELRRELAIPLIALMSMVGLVLLIACANVANLLLVRTASRRKELAIRLALGAGRMELVRLLLIESTALALGGGILGLIASRWLVTFLLGLFPPEAGFQNAFTVSPDLRVLLFTFAVALATGIVFGLAPATQFRRSNLSPGLKSDAPGVSSRSGARLRQALVAVQIGLSLLLLVVSGLFGRSLYNLKNLNFGFDTSHLLTFTIDPAKAGYTPAQIFAFFDRAASGALAQPGVRSVTFARVPLLANDITGSAITVPGYQPKEGEDMTPDQNEVAPGYFGMMGTRLVEGREFTSQDAGSAAKVVIVNQKFGRFFFGDKTAVGHFIGINGENRQIIGVVQNAKYTKVREQTPRFVYMPYLQDPHPGGTTFYLRTWQQPALAAAAMRRMIQSMDPGIPIQDLHTMDDQIDHNLWMDRIVTTFSVGFGVLATLLAAIGLYGVVSCAVAGRAREIGIRMAVGATQRNVLVLVMAEVGALAGIAMAIALPVSLGVARLIRSLLYGVGAQDPMTVIGAVVLLILVAALAGYLPARRAARLDPMIVLRHE